MKEIAVILPTAALLYLLLLGREYIVSSRLPCREAGSERDFFMTRRDHLLAWGLAAVYAAAAFAGLGDTGGPRSFCRPVWGEELRFTLPEGERLQSIRAFSGLGTGSWELYADRDGQWEHCLTLEQNYVAVLKWNEAAAEIPPAGSQYCLMCSGEPELGELGLYNAAGERLRPVSFSDNAAALFDEQDSVPERSTYLNSSYFDEIYHPRTAWEGLRGERLYEITHPPLGKLILSLGILLFGPCPFGWRFMGTLSGVLMLPVLYAFIKRLFGRRELAVCGTLIFAYDFMHFVQTRLATIDCYSVLFILLMYYFMYRWLDGRDRRPLLSLGLSGLFFGLGAASKWTCLYAGAGLGLLWLLYWLRRRELFRSRAFWKNVAFCLLFFVALPGAIYYLSYWPYGRAAGLSFPGMYFRGDYARLVRDNQLYMWNYHSGLESTHPYSSQWWQWLLDARPILYYLDYPAEGTKSLIAAFASPLLCWGGLLALAACAAGVWKRDGRAAFILLGYLAQLLPWVLVKRLTFAYHYFPSELFLLLALCWAFERMEERSGRRWPLRSFTAASFGLFLLFYPVLSGLPVPAALCSALCGWFGSWPF